MPVHPTAIVDARACVDKSASIGPYVVIEAPAQIGPDVTIAPYVHIVGRTEIGAGCRIHSGAVIGDLPQDLACEGAETYCRIGEGTIVREHVTVHRGTGAGSTTIVGRRCFLLAGCHVGHNCTVGDEVVLVNAVLLGGHVRVDMGAFLGGGAVVHQFVRIGVRAMIAGNARVLRDIPPFMLVDVDGHIAGVNAVGLRRAKIPGSQRDEIKQAYRILYRSGQMFSHSIKRLSDVVRTDAGKEILAFLTAPSQRGVAGRARSERPAEGVEGPMPS